MNQNSTDESNDFGDADDWMMAMRRLSEQLLYGLESLTAKPDAQSLNNLLFIASLQTGLSIAGISQLPFTSDQVSTAITGVIAVIASIYSWWRNNNLTGAAVQGQQLTNAIKANIIATDTDATTGTAQAAYAVSDSRGADATADVAPIEEVTYGDGE